MIEASETTTFDLHCVSHPVGEERCSSSHTCSIRPVWMLLQKKIDDVLDGVRLADLLAEESEVRTRVGLSNAPVVVEAGSCTGIATAFTKSPAPGMTTMDRISGVLTVVGAFPGVILCQITIRLGAMWISHGTTIPAKMRHEIYRGYGHDV